MKVFNIISSKLSNITTIDKSIIFSILLSVVVILIFYFIRFLGTKIIKKKLTERRGFVFNHAFKITINILEVIVLILLWVNHFKSIITLISVVSAAMTIALRDIILNFFCGLYIKFRKPFRIEDRIQIEDIKGDVINISSLDFEVLEVSTKDEYGQSTGVIVSFPNSTVLSKPLKNINRGFKYVWNEITFEIEFNCDLVKNKQEIYKIVNNIDVIKNIPKKMKNQINEFNKDVRIYYNKYDPMIFTKIVKDHIELTVRYLMHPKKARYVESVIWNKVYLAFKEGKINLFTGLDEPVFGEEEDVKPLEEEKPKKKKKKDTKVSTGLGGVLNQENEDSK